MVLKPGAEPGYSQIPLDAGPSPKNTFAVPKSENWLVVWNISFIFPIILGISSSQLTHMRQVSWGHSQERGAVGLPWLDCPYKGVWSLVCLAVSVAWVYRGLSIYCCICKAIPMLDSWGAIGWWRADQLLGDLHSFCTGNWHDGTRADKRQGICTEDRLSGGRSI